MLSQPVKEVIFIGLPGPTHHYSGLSLDNVAAVTNRGSVSNPKQAALQALDLVRLLKSLGIVAAILPPQLRPHLPLLRQHFSGDDDSVIQQAALSAPLLLEKSCSAASMWTANAATVAPMNDCTDGMLHITPANLSILKTGKARAIRLHTLAALCRELECQPGDLLVYVPGEENDIDYAV